MNLQQRIDKVASHLEASHATGFKIFKDFGEAWVIFNSPMDLLEFVALYPSYFEGYEIGCMEYEAPDCIYLGRLH